MIYIWASHVTSGVQLYHPEVSGGQLHSNTQSISYHQHQYTLHSAKQEISRCECSRNVTIDRQWQLLLLLRLQQQRRLLILQLSDVSPCLKAKFCGLGLAIVWLWPWDCGLGLKGLTKAKILADYKIHHWLPSTGARVSELYFKIHVPYLLTVGNRGLVRVPVLEKKQDFITFYRNPLRYGMALALIVFSLGLGQLALSVLALLT